MKKFMALLLVAGMTLSLTACGGSTDTAKTDQADGKDTFTVGFDQDFPPFGYVGDDGEFTGFDIEMATECAARMGKKIVLQGKIQPHTVLRKSSHLKSDTDLLFPQSGTVRHRYLSQQHFIRDGRGRHIRRNIQPIFRL